MRAAGPVFSLSSIFGGKLAKIIARRTTFIKLVIAPLENPGSTTEINESIDTRFGFFSFFSFLFDMIVGQDD